MNPAAAQQPGPAVNYAFYGCRLRSSFPLSLLSPCAAEPEPPDVVLNLGDVPEDLPNPIWSSPFVSIAADRSVLVRVKAVGRFLLRHGREITVQPVAGVAPPEIETFLVSSVAGVLLHQRGLLPLHASCVEIGGRAVALAGSCGRGKSTLAAALIRRGATLLSDDICVVRFAEDGAALAMQGVTGLRLWPDMRNVFQSDTGSWAPIRRDHPKHVTRMHSAEIPSCPLAAVIRLAWDNHAQPGLRRLHGPLAVSPMAEMIYRIRLGRLLDRSEGLFRDVMRLADTVPIFELRRPAGFDPIDQAAEWAAAAAEETA